MSAAEMVIYSVLSYLPYIALALFPFRNDLRFSKRITVLLVIVSGIFQILIGLWAGLWGGNSALLSFISTVTYFVFYFSVVKVHFGKTLFTLLTLSNIANFVVISSKCIEGALFPENAMQGYRWSFSLIMVFVQAALLIPLWFYIRSTYTTVMEKDAAKPTWRFLWLIPATFYVEWYYHLYSNSGKSSLELALEPESTLFLFIINLGAVFIYHMVVCHIKAIEANIELSEKNHALQTQHLQYENLQERIAEARRFKHDIRHNVLTVLSFLEDEKYDEAKNFLEAYNLSMPDDRSVCFCKNYSVNAILLFFAQQAKDAKIDFITVVDVPEDIGISDNVISVLLGNLLENAVEASSKAEEGSRRVTIKSVCNGGTILFKISNTYVGELVRNKSGLYMSTKHSGSGIGLASVRNIVKQNGGMLKISDTGGEFAVTVMLMQE